MDTMREIILTQDQVALVDDADYNTLMTGTKWYAKLETTTQRFYAVRTVRDESGRRVQQQMHQYLLGVNGRQNPVDHKNHNTLDNQRSNLRLASAPQNKQNSLPYRGGHSAYKGVTYKAGRRKCWTSSIRVDGRLKSLGYYESEIDAARAYDAAARLYFGEFAYCNFPLTAGAPLA